MDIITGDGMGESMRRRISRIGILGAIAGLFSSSAGAITPASREQLVCGASSMVRGEVVEARSKDCRLTMPPNSTFCIPTELIHLKVRVIEVMPNSQDEMQKGDVIDVASSVIYSHPIWVNGSDISEIDYDNGMRKVPDTGKPLTDDIVTEAFVGKEFNFGIAPQRTSARERFWVKMWKPDGDVPVMWETTCAHSPWRPKPHP
ncbi:hypothetical protein UCD39_03245 [Nitrospirillum sp. BR 11752]|uniref:hypothetical protein n=1 Tax=Nitrospirillum sp. BR 11752 TaxID=3104293 RepID=UPI002EA5EC81|nr:hypothetical protein [Nitrospirillum sp. BR 11752]